MGAISEADHYIGSAPTESKTSNSIKSASKPWHIAWIALLLDTLQTESCSLPTQIRRTQRSIRRAQISAKGGYIA